MSATNYNWTTITTPYAKIFATKTDGDVAAGAAADVTGLTLTFSLSAAPSPADIRFYAMYSGSSPMSFTIVINIDGADVYSFSPANINNGAGGDSVSAWPGTLGVMHTFVATGSHTVKIRQSGANATLLADATSPATLVIDYQP